MNLKRRRDLLDYDYLNKLSDEELKWLNKFTEEYVHGTFKKGRNLIKKKNRKEVYDRNNAQNRCILNLAKAYNKIKFFSEIEDEKKKGSRD